MLLKIGGKFVKSKLGQFFSGFLKQLLWHRIETIGLFLYFVQWRFDIILSHHGITLGPSSLSYCNLRGKFEFSNWVDGCIWGTSRCGEVIWSSTSVNLLDWMIKSLKKKRRTNSWKNQNIISIQDIKGNEGEKNREIT